MAQIPWKLCLYLAVERLKNMSKRLALKEFWDIRSG